MELTEEGNIVNISEKDCNILNNTAINDQCSETINYLINNQKNGLTDSEDFDIPPS